MNWMASRSELGYEIFLRDGAYGDILWERLMEVGAPLGLNVGHTSTIRRIEGAMLSYITDMNIENNPFEMGWGRLVDLDMQRVSSNLLWVLKLLGNHLPIQMGSIGLSLLVKSTSAKSHRPSTHRASRKISG